MKRQQRAGISFATACAAAALTAVFAQPAAAHPHVWITVETTVVYEQGSIAAIRHKWSFDEFYTAMAIQGLDTNNDGNYDRQELAELAKVNMDGLKEFAFFTHVKLSDQSLAIEEPRDFYLEYVESNVKGESEPEATQDTSTDKAGNPGVVGRVQGWFSSGDKAKAAAPKPKVLSLHFTLPLKQPVLSDAPGFSFSVSDPTFFIAFELAKNDPVKLEGAPAGCRATIGGAERDAEDAKRLGEAFFNQLGGQGFGLSIAKPISIACETKP
jgi:ABC-type uncharacterized transport system substrate-binding protein